MARNLDLNTLRSFVTIAEVGGVTRAAGILNLTQSAVSMQIKRLEDTLDVQLFLRASRKLTLTAEGDQLLSYARRMLALNDEVLDRLTATEFEGELRLGVPHDIVHPAIPVVLQRLAAEYPRMRVNLVSSFTDVLKDCYLKGALDVILTTEDGPGEGGEVLAEQHLEWIGAIDGSAWQKRPLRLGFEDRCKFRPIAQAALDRAGIAWEMAYSGQSSQVMEATTSADLSVTVRMAGAVPRGCEAIRAGAALPDLGNIRICLYQTGADRSAVLAALVAQLRCAYSGDSGAEAGVTTTLPVDFRSRSNAKAASA